MSTGRADAQQQQGGQGKTLSRAERETQTAAERLQSQIEDALAAVAVRAGSDVGELEASAGRLERAARDLAVALRELAKERQGEEKS